MKILTSLFAMHQDKSSNRKWGKFDEFEKITLVDKEEDAPPPVVISDDEIRRILNGDSKKEMSIMNVLIPSPDRKLSESNMRY
jgi:hypothetical protein